MDLILLSFKPFPLPLIESNIRLQSQSDLKCTMLAIVTSTTSSSRERGRDSNSVGSIQILALRKNWEYIRITNINEMTDSSKKKRDGFVKMNYIIIDSLVSRWREFMAMSEIINIKLKESVVYANVELIMRPSPPKDIDSSIETDEWKEISGLPKKLRKVLKNKFNESQLLAIRMACRDENKITLVQGPPGTGKTTTIIGILNALHVREYNRYYKSCIDELIGPIGIQCRNSKDIKSWTKFISSLSKKKPHILVVAPSNVAVDNIIQRIMEKEFYDGNGSKYKPDMLRIGAGKTASVQSVSLEDKMKLHQLGFLSEKERVKAQNDIVRDMSDIVEQIKIIQSYLINLSIAFKLHQLPENWELRIDPATANPYWVDHAMQISSPNPPIYSNQLKSHYRLELLPEYQFYAQEVTSYLEQLTTLNLLLTRSKAKTNPDEFGGHSEARQAVETSIIEEAHLLCTTVNSAGHPSLESTDFEIVVIDEACQCLEPAALIALRRGCKRCIMVGDPQQLPATIFADSNKKSGFEVSLFERLMKAGQQVILLDRQYRMHPEINNFPSLTFYDSRLCNGMNVQDENYSPPHLKSLFLPFLFFNLQTSREEYQHTSCSNTEEVTLCQNVLETLILEARSYNVKLGSVGIISPYSDQIYNIKKRLSEKGYFGESRSLYIPKAGYDYYIYTIF
jgi:senataxin